MSRILVILSMYFLMLLQANFAIAGDESSKLAFDDKPLNESLDTPDWFNLSFLDLNDSLKEALNAGKRGIIIYFGRKDCAYCKAQLEVNWGQKDIVEYTKKHFDVIAIDVRGEKTVTDFNGDLYTEKNFAAHMKTDFTPSLVFYIEQKQIALKLSGYRPPYQFRASLEYVADAHYKREPFREYLARAEKAFGFGQEELNANSLFVPAPYNLDRSTPAKKPLIVFFEHPRCHACDVMHGGPMNEDEIKTQLKKFDIVQLDSTSDTQVTTPTGDKITSKEWSRQLNLSFAPTLIFFNEEGKEIIRVDSVIRLYRMKKLLSYVLSKGYLTHTTFQNWRDSIKN